MRAASRGSGLVRPGAAILLAWCFCASLDAAGLAEQIPQREYDTLVAFYNETGGSRWRYSNGWLNPAAEEWAGVAVEGVVLTPTGAVIRQGHVTRLVLPLNDLAGFLPPELDALTYLEALVLWGNRISGPIPPSLGNFPNLEALILWGNELSGPIPPSLGNLQRLTDLDLSYNHLTGRIPPELGNLTSLQYLDLSATPLMGPLPRELGNLSALKSFTIQNTRIDGSLPAELGNLRNLQILDLNNSRFSGSIPPELGNLAELLFLDLNLNRFTGEIPPDLARLTKLVVLKLAANQLTGSFPVALTRLSALTVLALARNNLTGSIPPELGNMGMLQDFSLAYNELTGSIPDDLGRLTHLHALDLSSNQLTGSVPQSLSGLPEIHFIDVSFNNLTGDIPDHFTSTQLFFLNFTRNNFDLTPGSRFRQAIESLRAQGIGAADSPQNGPNKLVNISGRARVGAGDNVLIAGLILQAPLYGSVTLRGLGPSLLQNGLNDPLPDPFLALYGTIEGRHQIVTENDNWPDGLNLIDPVLEPKDNRESCIVHLVDSGAAYTAILKGKNGAQGVGLVDIFAPDGVLESEPVNLSVRGSVGNGDDVLIAGFMIGPLGPGSATILLRGIGPSLTQAGIPNPLQDPILELHGPNGDLLAVNDSWKQGQPAEIEQTGLAPTDDREAVILADLGPGGYTAILRGENNTTGIGLAEIYKVNDR